MRISLTLSKEQFDTLNIEKGLFSLSAWIRSKLFSQAAESLKNTDLKEWIDLLMTVSDRDRVLKELIDDAKRIRSGKTAELFVIRLCPHGFTSN